MGDMDKPEHIRILEQWMKSYKPEELFDAQGKLKPELAELAPGGHRRMSDNPHANGGLLCAISRCPISATTLSKCQAPGQWKPNRPANGQDSPGHHEVKPRQQKLPPVRPR